MNQDELEIVHSGDQSEFAESAPLNQSPPEEADRLAYLALHRQELARKKRNMVLSFLGIVGFFTLVAVLISLPKTEVISDAPVPTPTLMPAGPSRLEQELTRLDRIVAEADPGTKPFIPPPVDMGLKF
jgi:hypothetical protein